MRLDKYLKLARIIKRRTVAQDLCNADKVYVNNVIKKPSYEVKIGDSIKIIYGDKEWINVVEELPYEKKKKN